MCIHIYIYILRNDRALRRGEMRELVYEFSPKRVGTWGGSICIYIYMCIYICICIHTYVHTYIRAYIHTTILTYIYIYTITSYNEI